MSTVPKFPDAAGRPACLAPRQLSFSLERPAPTLPEARDLHLDVKRILARDIRECCLSREEILDRMLVLTGRQVGLATLDAMVSETKDHRFPAEWVPAWVIATGSRRLLDLLCTVAGFWLADSTEHELAELARLNIEAKKASRRAEQLRKNLEAAL